MNNNQSMNNLQTKIIQITVQTKLMSNKDKNFKILHKNNPNRKKKIQKMNIYNKKKVKKQQRKN